jgi:hypothetical protein
MSVGDAVVVLLGGLFVAGVGGVMLWPTVFALLAKPALSEGLFWGCFFGPVGFTFLIGGALSVRRAARSLRGVPPRGRRRQR